MRELIAIAAIVLLFGCASAPPAQREVESRVELPGASFEAVWNGVIDLFGERHWPITNMERASGFIATDRLTVDRFESYVDCGRPPALEVFRNHAVRFNVIVRNVEGGTSLAVNTAWSAVRTSGLNPAHQIAVTCVSTGELERQILEEVRRRVVGPRALTQHSPGAGDAVTLGGGHGLLRLRLIRSTASARW